MTETAAPGATVAGAQAVPGEPVGPGAAAPVDLRWTSALRIAAIAAVLLIHVVTWLVLDYPDMIGKSTWWTAAFALGAARFAVPCFVMISGALLLDPSRRESPREFYRKRAARIGVPLVVWTVVYIPFGGWAYGQPVHGRNWIFGIASGDPFLQIYYLYLIAGLYLGTPFLRMIVDKCTRSELRLFAAVALGLCMLDDAARDLFGIGGGWTLASQFVPYFGYFVLGYVLRDLVVTRRVLTLGAASLLAGVACTATGMWALAPAQHPPAVMQGSQYTFDPTGIPVVLTVFGVWIWSKRLFTPARPGPKRDRAVRFTADATFGVYLLHPLVLFPLLKTFSIPFDLGGYWQHALSIWLATLVASFAGAMIAGRIPLLRRLV